MLCVTLYWVIIWRKALRFGGFAAPGHSKKNKNKKQEGEQNGKKTDPAQRESRKKRRLQIIAQ
jgi:hypothetical protein